MQSPLQISQSARAGVVKRAARVARVMAVKRIVDDEGSSDVSGRYKYIMKTGLGRERLTGELNIFY